MPKDNLGGKRNNINSKINKLSTKQLQNQLKKKEDEYSVIRSNALMGYDRRTKKGQIEQNLNNKKRKELEKEIKQLREEIKKRNKNV